ncbi:hypothetical protein VitviT2T_030563 [Vitis vinifera]|uniref:Thioredoxin domain-containing protein n=1 Tax=Vitis vinifera TaxID=29760 RepID=A0ABY9E010_VITVI|nr:hypothetical protein VitviT2T_030563 [Vitis vinifera]
MESWEEPAELEYVKQHGVSVFLMTSGILGILYSLMDVLPLFSDTAWGQSANLDFLKNHMGAPFEKRPQPWQVTTNPEDVHSNDFLAVSKKFWVPWCGPYCMIHPMINELAKQCTGKLKCYKVNTDESPCHHLQERREEKNSYWCCSQIRMDHQHREFLIKTNQEVARPSLFARLIHQLQIKWSPPRCIPDPTTTVLAFVQHSVEH